MRNLHIIVISTGFVRAPITNFAISQKFEKHFSGLWSNPILPEVRVELPISGSQKLRVSIQLRSIKIA